MRINFFEEYPSHETFEKAKLIDFPSTMFIAGHSLRDFFEHKNKLLEINPHLEVAYWPILPHSYWFSPFSNSEDLCAFVSEMKTNTSPITILLDLELPLVSNQSFFIRNIFSIRKNKKIIQTFLAKAPQFQITIVTAEYPPIGAFFRWMYCALGISFDPKKYGHTSCVMYYSSMIRSRIARTIIKKTLCRTRQNENEHLELGLGTIATGVTGKEPQLTIPNLEHDLVFMKENGFQTATIFRLGGLTSDYARILRAHSI